MKERIKRWYRGLILEIIHTIQEMQEYSRLQKKNGFSIGFVPTMGFLHAGHTKLISQSTKPGQKTVVSIFVNPLQFNDPSDFAKYPKNIEGDVKICRKTGTNCLFLPDEKEMYPFGKPSIVMQIPNLMNKLCSKHRPGHFEGVLLVVARLFHIVNPDFAYFGKKDLQQYNLIKQMKKDLLFPIEIIGVETVREENGLAMSSRNARLSEQEMESAALIPRGTKLALGQFALGERSAQVLKSIVSEVILTSPDNRIEYMEIVDPDTLEEVSEAVNGSILALAIYCGDVRLIDAIPFNI